MTAPALISRIASAASAGALLILGLLNILGGIWVITWIGQDAADWPSALVFAVPMLVAGGLTMLAARGERGRGDRIGYVVVLALAIQLAVIPDIWFLFGLALLILQLGILAALTVRFPSSAGIKLVLVGFALACLSAFIFQRMGPTIGVYGNHCGDPPEELCYGPVLGAGFPLQFVLDSTGTSVLRKLGLEDNLLGRFLVLDILAYCLAIIGSYRLVRTIRSRTSKLGSHWRRSMQSSPEAN